MRKISKEDILMRKWLRRKPNKIKPVKTKHPDVVIVRGPSTDHGTFGFLNAKGVFRCVTVEPPDYDNLPNYSRIPAGRYVCEPHTSPRFGECYLITNIKGRSWVLTHSGNLGGDRKKGFKSHTLGCIILGKYFGRLSDQKAVMVSKVTVRKFNALMGREKFILEIKEV
jgi:hypothetical protein